MNNKPELFRYKNLKVSVFENGNAKKPCFVISRGVKNKETGEWFNLELSCFLSDLREYLKLFEQVLDKYDTGDRV